MMLISINCFLCWSIWGNVFLNLIAIGGCCGLLLLIWKGLCWLDSWRWGKKQHQKADCDPRYSVLKEFKEAVAMLSQSIKNQDKNTESISMKYPEIKGNLKIIRQLTDMCFNPEEIEKIVDDKVVVKIMVNYSNLYSLLQNIMSVKSKEELPKEQDIQQSYISLLIEYEKLSKDIKNPSEGKKREDFIKEWISDDQIKELQNKLNGYIDDIDKCIKDCLKNNDNGQTQQ